jgi:hypothetical protein
MTFVQPTGAVLFCDQGFVDNSSLFAFTKSTAKLYLEGSLQIKTTGATGTLQTDTIGRIYTTDGLGCSGLNIGPHMLPTGA